MKRKIVVTAYLCIFVGCAWVASLFATSLHDTLEIKENKDRGIPPTNKKKLLKWLKAGTYLETHTAEDQVHDSVGPHGGMFAPTIIQYWLKIYRPIRQFSAGDQRW